MRIDKETKTQLKRIAEESKINPQHAQAMADGTMEVLNRATREE